MNIREIWEQFKAAFEQTFTERRIKTVDSWDGSATNYADTDAYCAACLIDVNAAAGRDTKAQAYCMLPVRGPGDSADTFVQQAVFAAAAGRGIGRISKPADVPSGAWDAAVQAAARKLLDAYRQMERDAPLSLYKYAGLEPPQRLQRAAGDGVAVYRSADGAYRWAAVACTAFVNRSAEIDSMALFDDFVRQFKTNPAALDFFHLAGTPLGQVDFLAREGVALLAGGTFADNPLALAVARSLSAKPTGWGTSIAYQPTSAPDWALNGAEFVPVYRAGVLKAVSILPETAAAALFTEISSVGGEPMREEVRQALTALVGEELAEETARRVDGLNERAADPASGLIYRQVDPETVAALIEQVRGLEGIVEKLAQQLAGMGETMEEAKAEAAAERAQNRQRLEALETRAAEDDKRRAAEMPVVPPTPSYRPSQNAPAGDATPTAPNPALFQSWK